MPDVNQTEISLPDYIAKDLRILSVGLNPSLPSVEKGFYFANPRNRFWKAFNQAELIDRPLVPNNQVHQILLENYSIGFTDVVKRPSRMGHELRVDDFKRDAPKLREKLERYQPRLIWFHGKVAMGKFMQYGFGLKQTWKWGLNDIKQLDAKIYVTPNPSPANAAYSLDDLITSYKPLIDV